MMKAIIFGISGQDGHYLSTLLQEKGIEVTGISRSEGNWQQGNIADYGFVETLIKKLQPDYIFHFAANSTTRHSALFENHAAISTGALNILEAVYKHSKHTKVFLSGSAVQFENKGLPIDENTAFAPLSPYAVARIQSVYAGRYYRSLGIAVYVGYFFNHDSPLRTEKHINKKITEAVRRIQNGSKEIVEIGNLDTRKEFSFAGDIIDAVWRLVNQDKIYEVVLGSGLAYSIKEWIEICCATVGNPEITKQFVQMVNKSSDYDILVSNPTLIEQLGWQPRISIEELAKIMLLNE